MPTDSTTTSDTGDTSAETVEEPPVPERRPPPPDTPGADGGPSRADSRAGAAAANASDRAQADGELGEEKSETDEDVSAESSTTGEASAQGPETSTASDGAPDREKESDSPPDTGGQGQKTEDQALSPSDSLESAEQPIGTPDTAADVTDPGTGEDGEAALTDAAPQEEDRSATENAPVEDGEAVDAEIPDADATTGETLGRPDDVVSARKDVVPATEAAAIAEAAKDAKNLPKAPDAGRTSAADRDVPSRRLEPLSDPEYTKHTAHVESAVSDSLARGESTDVQHTLDPGRTIWHPERAELHQQIVDDLYSAATDVPNDGQAIVAGGLGGAGKSTTLEDHAGIDRSNYLTINPDDIKESLAKRGLVPPVEGLAPMERSALIHEESSQIARSLAGRAYADRKNVIWDITMSSKLSAAKRVQQLRDAGYSNVEGIFVHIPVATSVERAQERHRRGLEDYRNGEGLGGRYVPPDVIRANSDATWGSVNRGVFQELKPQFDKWKLYDNSVDGRGPMLLESSEGSERNNDE